MVHQRKGQPALCPYCCIRPGTTKDHVIPKCLFPDPLPNGINLPTVKACAECNNVNKSDDDTYLRDVLVTDIACSAKPAARGILLGEANRAMRRNQSTFARGVLNTVRHVQLQTPSGLYVGTGYTAEVDLRRMHRIFAKITRGLFFKRNKELLPRDILFTTMRVDVDTSAQMSRAPGLTWYFPPKLGDVFACIYCLGAHETYDTLWLMGFYDQFCIVVRTGMGLTAPQTSSPAVERAFWTMSDLSVIARPDRGPRQNAEPGAPDVTIDVDPRLPDDGQPSGP
jgi:hypothetical protein